MYRAFQSALLCLLPCLCTTCSFAEEKQPTVLPGPIATAGKLLFEDDFQREGLGDWEVRIPGFVIKDGVLIGTQDKKEHGSVLRKGLPMKDVVMKFRFNLAGSPRFNLVFDDKSYKGSHAGHICRVAYAQRQIRLGDDREGVMKNEIFKLRREKDHDQDAVAKMLEGRGSMAQVKLESDRWYSTTIEIVGDEMRVSLDGKPISYLKSPGIGHPTKQSVHFTVSGKEMRFDDVQIFVASKK